jgi:type III secretion protein J
MRRQGWKTAALAMCLVLAACGRSELYSKLSEGQANEMIAVLQAAGIAAEKEDGGELGWTVTTGRGDFGHAVEILHAQGYPRDDFASLGTVFKKEGFVSSPTEERARLIFGLSQELSHTISQIDGVVQARVHLALPQDQPLSDKKQPSSASVFIKYRPGSNVEAQVGKVKALLVNSIEGMKYDNVSVETFPAAPMMVTQVERPSRWPGIAGALAGVIAVVVALVFGYPQFRRWQQRRGAIVRRDLP